MDKFDDIGALAQLIVERENRISTWSTECGRILAHYADPLILGGHPCVFIEFAGERRRQWLREIAEFRRTRNWGVFIFLCSLFVMGSFWVGGHNLLLMALWAFVSFLMFCFCVDKHVDVRNTQVDSKYRLGLPTCGPDQTLCTVWAKSHVPWWVTPEMLEMACATNAAQARAEMEIENDSVDST